MSEAGGEKARVVVVGGGIAGLEGALALRSICGSRVDVTLVAPANTYTYRPLAVAEPFGLAKTFRINLGEFAEATGVSVQLGEADSVDTGSRRVHCTNGTSYDYDYLLVATGAVRRPVLRNAISFADHEGIREFEHLLYRIERGEVEAVAFTSGARVGWFLPMYELALMTAAFAEGRGAPVELAVVTPEESPLVSFGPRNSADVAKLLEGAGITVLAGSRPTEWSDHELRLVPDRVITADEVVALPDLAGPAVPGLPGDSSGFISVDDACRVRGGEREFAAGDASDFPVKQGGIAAQMAHAAVRAIAVELDVLVDAKPFSPTLDGTLLTGNGAHHLRQSLAMGTREGSLHHLSPSWLPMTKVSAPFLSDYLAEHSDFPSSSGELESDRIVEDLKGDWESRAIR
jgi:sulfide:quinone oxidoreductase